MRLFENLIANAKITFELEWSFCQSKTSKWIRVNQINQHFQFRLLKFGFDAKQTHSAQCTIQAKWFTKLITIIQFKLIASTVLNVANLLKSMDKSSWTGQKNIRNNIIDFIFAMFFFFVLNNFPSRLWTMTNFTSASFHSPRIVCSHQIKSNQATRIELNPVGYTPFASLATNRYIHNPITNHNESVR